MLYISNIYQAFFCFRCLFNTFKPQGKGCSQEGKKGSIKGPCIDRHLLRNQSDQLMKSGHKLITKVPSISASMPSLKRRKEE